MARQAARMQLDPSPLDQTPDSGQCRRQMTANGVDSIPSFLLLLFSSVCGQTAVNACMYAQTPCFCAARLSSLVPVTCRRVYEPPGLAGPPQKIRIIQTKRNFKMKSQRHMREKYQGSQGTCNTNKNSPSQQSHQMWAGGGEDSPPRKKKE